MVRKMANIFGVVLLVVGVLGFIPGITTGSMNDGMLLGLFHVNILHDVIHILSGVLALAAGMSSAKASKMYFMVFGVIYALVAILGFINVDKDILGVVASNVWDTWLHVVIAVLALYFGFAAKDEEEMPVAA